MSKGQRRQRREPTFRDTFHAGLAAIPSVVENPSSQAQMVYLSRLDADQDWMRGRPFFELRQAYGYDVIIGTPGAALDLRRCAIVFGHPIDRITSGLCLCRIIDVTFPIWDADTWIDPQGEAVNASEDVQLDWIEQIRMADAVTVSRVEWVDPVAELNPRTFLLRDMGDTVEDFARLTAGISDVMRHAYDYHRSQPPRPWS